MICSGAYFFHFIFFSNTTFFHRTAAQIQNLFIISYWYGVFKIFSCCYTIRFIWWSTGSGLENLNGLFTGGGGEGGGEGGVGGGGEGGGEAKTEAAEEEVAEEVVAQDEAAEGESAEEETPEEEAVTEDKAAEVAG